jgi:multiple sugar transport system substrate-binding protein
MRFHAMSTQAAADKNRAAESAKFIEWFGGKADGKYQFQKTMFTNTGTGFGVKELFKDPEILTSYQKYGDLAMYEKQQKLVKKKDVITRWFGEWDDVNGAAWQSAVIGKSTVDEALKKSAQSWNQLKKQA